MDGASQDVRSPPRCEWAAAEIALSRVEKQREEREEMRKKKTPRMLKLIDNSIC